MTPRKRAAPPHPVLSLPIETPRLVLREFRPGDIERIHAYASREEVTRYLIWGPNSLSQTAEALSGFLEDGRQQPRQSHDLGIVLKSHNLLIGAVGLRICDAESSTGDIGYVLHPEFWGHGYAEEATRALIHLGFRSLGLRRIIGQCDQRNKASARVMERLGMRREGAFRASRLIQDEWQDEYLYAILEQDFQA
jgi:ribosomal-protein-alanine N-acetyltransferase